MSSPVGGPGACPQEKKSILRLKKLSNSEQVLVLLSYITAESGGIIPSSESGGPIPPPPCCDAYAHIPEERSSMTWWHTRGKACFMRSSTLLYLHTAVARFLSDS